MSSHDWEFHKDDGKWLEYAEREFVWIPNDSNDQDIQDRISEAKQLAKMAATTKSI